MQIGFVVNFTLGNQDGLQEFEAARPFDRLWGQGLSHQQRHSADKIAPRNGVILSGFFIKKSFSRPLLQLVRKNELYLRPNRKIQRS